MESFIFGMPMLLIVFGIFSFKQSRVDIPMNISHDVMNRIEIAISKYNETIDNLLRKGVESGIIMDSTVQNSSSYEIMKVVNERKFEYLNSIKSNLKTLALVTFAMATLFLIAIFSVIFLFKNYAVTAFVIILVPTFPFFCFAYYTYFVKPDKKGHALIRFFNDETQKSLNAWKL